MENSNEERQEIKKQLDKLEIKLDKLRKKHKFKDIAKVTEQINRLKWRLEQ